MFQSVDATALKQIGERLEYLSKSFAAGYQGIQNAGRTGVSALANDHLDPVLRTITMTEQDFYLTKDIPTLKATQSVYMYKVKTAVGGNSPDLAGFEAFLPQEDTSQYISVAEVLKVYGIRKSITHMAQLINEGGGYSVDLEKENDQNAALKMAEASERDLYVGGDNYIDPFGEIDGSVNANINIPSRNVRGIQANIREGDKSQRGIPGDYIGYGNNRSVLFDRKGAVLDRKFVDQVVTAVHDNNGAIREAHCTTSQVAEFRATFFPIERSNIGDLYAIRGPNVTNDYQKGFNLDTCNGPLQFVPTKFRYGRNAPVPRAGSVGTKPNTTVIASTAAGASVLGKGSGFQVGEAYRYRVMAVNIAGSNAASPSVLHTVAAGEENKPVELTITNVSGVEYYELFRTPLESAGQAGTEMFIGKIIPQNGVSTIFVDNNRLIPGLDPILFMPADKKRVQLAVLGPMLNKLDLGRQGLASEHVYASYFACVVDAPRSLAIADNVFQDRNLLSY